MKITTTQCLDCKLTYEIEINCTEYQELITDAINWYTEILIKHKCIKKENIYAHENARMPRI